MKLLDTNVFIYARGRAHPLKEPCTSVLADAEARPDGYGVDVETLQEILDVYSRRGERAFAIRMVGEILASFPDPLPVTRREVEEAAEIVGAEDRLSPRDAVHAGVVLTYGLEGLVSTDRSFDLLASVTRFDPADLASSLK